jgi:hypothetical protein
MDTYPRLSVLLSMCYFDTSGQDPEKVLPKIHEALKIARPDGRDLNCRGTTAHR